jgi:hypothetical protein
MDTYVVMLKYIRDYVEPSSQFQAYCCAFEFFRDCVLSLTHYLCNQRLGYETSAFVNHKLVTTQKNFADIQGCGIDTGDKSLCSRTSSNITDVLDAIASSPYIEAQYESPVFLFMDIASRHSVKKSTSKDRKKLRKRIRY